MRAFIAGIMQGSRVDGIEAQDYRGQISEILQRHLAGVEVLDPFQLHPNSLAYGPEQAKQTLLEMAQLAGQADLLVACLPSASMGTAIEMWHAYQAGVPIYTISPLTDNWVVLSLSTRVFSSASAFETFVAEGGLSDDAPPEPFPGEREEKGV